MIDIDAGATVPTHFTDSVDYVVITHGELDLEFIDGSKVTANTGDLVIQLGNIHTWKNVSSAPARKSASMPQAAADCRLLCRPRRLQARPGQRQEPRPGALQRDSLLNTQSLLHPALDYDASIPFRPAIMLYYSLTTTFVAETPFFSVSSPN